MNTVIVDVKAGICSVTINRPDRKNSLTKDMYIALTEAIQRAEDDQGVRVLVLQGAEGTFSAGNDLDDFIENPPEGPEAEVFEFVRNLAKFSKPVIAAVRGLAIGIGATMLLHCDLVYASESSKFSFPFVGLGVVPEAGSTWLLPRLIGYPQAAEKLFFGEPFTAQEALSLGLVNRTLSDEQLDPFVADRAARLAALPKGSLKLTKALLKDQIESGGVVHPIESRIDLEAKYFAQRLKGQATQEAIAAFKQKRKPDFSDCD